jgi:hypothetical protein
MVAGKRVEPGPELRNLFSSCGGEEVEAAVRARIQGLADLFTARYTAPTETHPGSQVPARTFRTFISGLQAGLRIRIHLIRIRIQDFRLKTDLDPGVLMTKN